MRLIDAELIKYEPMLSSKGNGQYEEVSVAYKSQIDDLPTIEERKKGKWIHAGTWTDPYTADEEHVCQCSVCGQEVIGYGTSNFCSKCGARMER